MSLKSALAMVQPMRVKSIRMMNNLPISVLTIQICEVSEEYFKTMLLPVFLKIYAKHIKWFY